MVDYKKQLILEISQQEVALRETLLKLRLRYRIVKMSFILFSAITLLYVILSVLLFNLYENINFFKFLLYQSVSLMILIITLLILNMSIKKYNNCFHEGFSIWCKLADIADWSILRRVFYFKNEKLIPIISAINDFYNEFNKFFSPQRVDKKYIFYLKVSLLLVYFLTLIYSLHRFNILSLI